MEVTRHLSGLVDQEAAAEDGKRVPCHVHVANLLYPIEAIPVITIKCFFLVQVSGTFPFLNLSAEPTRGYFLNNPPSQSDATTMMRGPSNKFKTAALEYVGKSRCVASEQ
jgi:hypothetical protein